MTERPPTMAEVSAWPSERLMRRVEAEPLPANIAALLATAAARWPDRPVLEFFDDGETITYAELDRRVARAANALAALGVGHGDHVGLMVHTSSTYPVTWLALASIGAVTVPINYNYMPRELHYMLSDSHARFLVIHDDLLAIYEGMEAAVVPRDRVVVIGEGGEGYPVRWEVLIGAAAESFTPAQAPTLDDLMNIQYTSGTTGLPKGAMQTQRFWLTYGVVGAAQFQNQLKRVLIAQPFYYVDAQWLLLLTMRQGATAYVARKQSATRFFGWLKQYRINYCNFPEVVSKRMARDDDADNDLIVMSCYSHRRENYAWYEERYGCLARQGFSMTELGCAIYVPMEAWRMTGTGTVGVPAAFREAKVCDPEGREVARGALGEICVRCKNGNSILRGYYKKDEAIARAFHPDGWFRTGDVGLRDAAGWFHYLGRMKDMVRRSGENVSAVEVEGVLRAVPGVLEAAVVPVPDELRGEEVKAYLLLDPEKTHAEVPPEAVLTHCERNLARFKIPRYLEYCGEFPRTPSLKIKKSALLAARADLREGSYDRVDGVWR